jgi:peptide/nickel transport system substrate-binding protein
MKTRLLRLRFRRSLRKGKRQVEGFGTQAEQQIEQHLFKRIGRLLPVRRFVFAWVGLLTLLIGALVIQTVSLSGYYQTVRPVPGGIYNEGVKGRFTTANPIYASSDADSTVAKLIFAGLLKYDSDGKLVGDLARNYSVDAHGTTYTIKLKPNLTWHDDQPLTSDDVVFTFKSIQNPDAKSPLQAGWQGIEISAPDKQTVTFKLPGILAAFPHSLTTGIIPKHVLEEVSPADLRSADFNTSYPIGSGPFMRDEIQVENAGDPKSMQTQIGLVAFPGFNGGEPKLQQFNIKTYASEEQLITAFTAKQLNGVEGLTELPRNLKKHGVVQHSMPFNGATMVFFKTSSGILSEQPVRRALVQATDTAVVTGKLDYPARLVREPILSGQVGYDAALTQPKYDLKAAKTILDSSGWKPNGKNVRTKDRQALKFTLTVSDTADHRKIAQELKRQWSKLGVQADLRYLSGIDLQNALAFHDYDAILNSITIGADPDVFVYWDSSQADIRSANRLNLSEYKNTVADAALEAGRTRLDPSLRKIKYRPFLEAWQQDNPAIGLYQPRLLYLTNGRVAGLEEHSINTPTDRLANVENWQIRTAKVTN